MNNIKNINKLFLELRPSNIAGVGIFAIRTIPKDTVIFHYDNEDITNYKFKDLRDKGVPLSVINTLKKYCAHNKSIIQIPKNYNHEKLTYVHYLNHSDNSNIYYDFDKNIYITKRKIRPNEEILLDYAENNYCKSCMNFYK
jgi:uncharacterized membrane protein YcaP (DUF421 family)